MYKFYIITLVGIIIECKKYLNVCKHKARYEQFKFHQVQLFGVIQWHKLYTNFGEIRLTDSEVYMRDRVTHRHLGNFISQCIFFFLRNEGRPSEKGKTRERKTHKYFWNEERLLLP